MAERVRSEARSRPLPGGYGWYRFDAISLDGRHVLVVGWHSGFLFSPRYYDEVLDLRDRGGVQPDSGVELADPTDFGAFAIALYDRGRTAAYAIVESPLSRGSSDPWFPNLHGGEAGLDPQAPPPGAVLGLGENRLVRERDGSYTIEFSVQSKWTRATVEGSLKIRPLGAGSPVIPLTTGAEAGEGAQDWQIVASRTEAHGTIRWTRPFTRRHGSLDLHGLGYVDRIAGRLPIGPKVGRWLWGRFQGSEQTIAYYRLDPADAPLGPRSTVPGKEDDAVPAGQFLFHGDRTGGVLVDDPVLTPARVRRNRWGMPHPLELHGSGGGRRWKAEVVRIVDRGPFFLRCLSRLSCPDDPLDGVLGITECFLPARWDVPLYRLVARGRIRRSP